MKFLGQKKKKKKSHETFHKILENQKTKNIFYIGGEKIHIRNIWWGSRLKSPYNPTLMIIMKGDSKT